MLAIMRVACAISSSICSALIRFIMPSMVAFRSGSSDATLGNTG